jgi:hypothetical protein
MILSDWSKQKVFITSKRDVAMRENQLFQAHHNEGDIYRAFTVVCYLLARSMMHRHCMNVGGYNN